MKIDTSIKGILKSIFYAVVCGYSWLNEQGINAYALSVLLGFMILDMVLGVWKARRVDALKNPTSKEAKKGIITKLLIFIIPVVVGLIWGLFDKPNALKIVNMFIVALAIAEGYSIIGNAGAIYSGSNITEFDAITYIFRVSTNMIKTMLEKFIGNNTDEDKSST